MGIDEKNKELYKTVSSRHDGLKNKVQALVKELYEWGTGGEVNDIIEGFDKYIDVNGEITVSGTVEKPLLEAGGKIDPSREAEAELIPYSIIVNRDGISVHMDGNHHLAVQRRGLTGNESEKEEGDFINSNYSNLKKYIRHGIDQEFVSEQLNKSLVSLLNQWDRKLKVATEEIVITDSTDEGYKPPREAPDVMPLK